MTRTEQDLRTMLMDRADNATANPTRAAAVRARIDAARRRRVHSVTSGSVAAVALVATIAAWAPWAPDLGRGTTPYASTDLATPAPVHRDGGSTSSAYDSSLVIVPSGPARGMPDEAWGGHLIGEATLVVLSANDTEAVGTFTPTRWDLVVSAVCEPALPPGQYAEVLINGREFVRGGCDSGVSSGGSAGPDTTPNGLRTYWTTLFGMRLNEPSTITVRVVDENGEPVANPPLGTTVSGGIYASTTIPAPHTP